MEGYDDWDEFVERLARELAPALKRQRYDAHRERMMSLRSPYEKLVYFYLLTSQPQSFTSIRRFFDIWGKTLARTLKRLKDLGFVTQDEYFLYWVAEMDPME